MTWLIAGLIVFFAVHLVPSRPALRERLVQGLGEMPYKGVFSVLSLAGLALIVAGMGQAERIVIWQPPPLAGLFPAVVMAPALILLAASNFDNNIRRIVRHPMSLGILLWAGSHLAATGELAALLLFGSFAVFALFNLWSSNRRGGVAPAPPVSLKRDLLVILAGVIAYSLLRAFHGTLFGVPVF